MFAFPEALTGAMFSSEYSERGVLLPYMPAASLCSAIICFGLEASGRIKLIFYSWGASSIRKLSYERGCQEKNAPFLPPRGRLFDLHPALCCGLAAYFLSLTRADAGYISSVSCSDAGSTPSVREATQAGVLARGNLPTMILCETRGL